MAVLGVALDLASITIAVLINLGTSILGGGPDSCIIIAADGVLWNMGTSDTWVLQYLVVALIFKKTYHRHPCQREQRLL